MISLCLVYFPIKSIELFVLRGGFEARVSDDYFQMWVFIPIELSVGRGALLLMQLDKRRVE